MSADGMAVDLDREIANKVFGFECDRIKPNAGDSLCNFCYPMSYSSKIDNAFQVVEKMLKDGWSYEIGGSGEYHHCRFGVGETVYEESLPMAICKAAVSLSPGAGKEKE